MKGKKANNSIGFNIKGKYDPLFSITVQNRDNRSKGKRTKGKREKVRMAKVIKGYALKSVPS